MISGAVSGSIIISMWSLLSAIIKLHFVEERCLSPRFAVAFALHDFSAIYEHRLTTERHSTRQEGQFLPLR